MDKTGPTITVRLTDRWAEEIQRMVRDGDYPSADVLIAEALELWGGSRNAPALDTSDLKRAYDEGLASGPGRKVTALDFLEDMRSGRRARG